MDIITVITWERKIVGKHHHVESVQAKANQILQQVNTFKDLFTELFQKRIPSFVDEDGKLISQSNYKSLLVQDRLDHRKFEDMTQSLTRKVIIDKLAMDFEIMDSSRMIGSKFSPISYVDHMELRLLAK